MCGKFFHISDVNPTRVWSLKWLEVERFRDFHFCSWKSNWYMTGYFSSLISHNNWKPDKMYGKKKKTCVPTLHTDCNLWKKENEWVEWVLQSPWLLSAKWNFQGQWAWGLAEFKRQGGVDSRDWLKRLLEMGSHSQK